MTEDEEDRIAKRVHDETKWKTETDNRIDNLERTVGRIVIAAGAASFMIGTTLWDGLKGLLLK